MSNTWDINVEFTPPVVDAETKAVTPGEVKRFGTELSMFDTPEELWEDAKSYFEWATKNKLTEVKHFTHEGEAGLANVPKPRVFTKAGLYIHIGISRASWSYWKNPNSPTYRPDLVPAMELIDQVIWEQKFTHAAVGIFDSKLIVRDLGLANALEVNQNTQQPVQLEIVNNHETAQLYHPDDEECIGPLYTKQQLEAGVPWTA